MRFKKDVLSPGSYLVGGDWINFSVADLKDMAKTAKDMLLAGIGIPVVLEHQAGALPMSENDRRAQTCRNTCGWLRDAYMSGDTLEVVADVDDADAATVRKCRFCSPLILRQFVDGLGKSWGSKILGHLAITNCPVNYKQRDFVPLSRLGWCLSRDDGNYIPQGGSTMDQVTSKLDALKAEFEALTPEEKQEFMQFCSSSCGDEGGGRQPLAGSEAEQPSYMPMSRNHGGVTPEMRKAATDLMGSFMRTRVPGLPAKKNCH